jgi:hypothetical protein
MLPQLQHPPGSHHPGPGPIHQVTSTYAAPPPAAQYPDQQQNPHQFRQPPPHHQQQQQQNQWLYHQQMYQPILPPGYVPVVAMAGPPNDSPPDSSPVAMAPIAPKPPYQESSGVNNDDAVSAPSPAFYNPSTGGVNDDVTREGKTYSHHDEHLQHHRQGDENTENSKRPRHV